MTSQSPVLDASQRAWRYWFSDGLTNLVVGVGILLMSYSIMNPPHWPPKPFALAAWAIALVLYVLTTVRHREIVEWLKAKTTYPRTGYVSTPANDPLCMAATSLRGGSPQPEEATRLAAARRRSVYLKLALVVVASIGMIVIHQSWKWIAAGIIIAIAMLIARKQYRVSWIIPVGFPLLGLYLTLYATDRHTAPSHFLLGWGVLFVLDGGYTLVRYLLANPLPKEPTA